MRDHLFKDTTAERWSRYISWYALNVVTWLHNQERVKHYEINRQQPWVKKMSEAFDNEQDRIRAVNKDLHLVLLAFEADNRVVSNDQRLRNHLAYMTQKLDELATLLWPASLHESLDWLEKGAPDQPAFRLCASTS